MLPELSHGGRGFIKAARHAADIQNRFHRRCALVVPSVRFKLLAFADRLGVGGRLGGGDAGQRRQGRLGLRHELSSAAVPAAVGASPLCSARGNVTHILTRAVAVSLLRYICSSCAMLLCAAHWACTMWHRMQVSAVETTGRCLHRVCRARPARASRTACGGGAGCGASARPCSRSGGPAAAAAPRRPAPPGACLSAGQPCWASCSQAESCRCRTAGARPASSCRWACFATGGKHHCLAAAASNSIEADPYMHGPSCGCCGRQRITDVKANEVDAAASDLGGPA